LDVSLKEVSICVLDADGVVVAGGKVATEPALIVSWIGERIGAVERIVHESGPLAIGLVPCIAPLTTRRAIGPSVVEADSASGRGATEEGA